MQKGLININITKTNAPKLSSDEILVPTEHCFEFRRQGFVCSDRGLVTIGYVSYESFYVPGKRGDTNEMDS